jgi:hypothetical protein
LAVLVGLAVLATAYRACPAIGRRQRLAGRAPVIPPGHDSPPAQSAVI